MSFLQEFKEFASKGNVIDMAVGLIVGAGFGKIVSSLVSDVLMPPLGIVIGGVNFTGLKVTLKEAEGATAAVTLNYGTFLQTTFDFVIIAFAVFLLVKAVNRMKRGQAPAPVTAPEPSAEEKLLVEIRDLLKARS